MLTNIYKLIYKHSTSKLTDWQYITKIHQSFYQNNINNALKYLVNSYLYGVVLDRQTFHQIHIKMKQAKADISYHEVAYKLYRQNFSPHIQMVEWMKFLIDSSDDKTVAIIRKDYQSLGIEPPKIVQQQNILEQKEEKPIQLHETKTSSQVSTIEQKQKQQEIKQNYVSQKNLQRTDMIDFLNKIAQEFKDGDVKIVIENIEAEYEQNMMDEEEYEQTEDLENIQNSDHMDLPGITDVLFSAKRFKIGRVEIVKGKSLDNPDKQ